MFSPLRIRLNALRGKLVGVLHTKIDSQLKGILSDVGEDFIEITHGSTTTLITMAQLVTVEPKE